MKEGVNATEMKKTISKWSSFIRKLEFLRKIYPFLPHFHLLLLLLLLLLLTHLSINRWKIIPDWGGGVGGLGKHETKLKGGYPIHKKKKKRKKEKGRAAEINILRSEYHLTLPTNR
jgi:hypothetical protein